MIESQEMSKGTSVLKDLLGYLNSRKYIAQLVSLGFGIVLLSWLVAELDIRAAIEIIRDVPVSLLVAGFLCYGLGFYFRAMRFRLLLPADKPIDHLFPIVLVHYTALNIIPARLGEVSYIYLLKKVNNVSTGCSVSNLLLARVFDHITISVLFLISSLFLDLSSQWLHTLKLAVSGFLILTCAALVLMLLYKEKCAAWLSRVLARLKFDKFRLVQRIFHEIQETITAFQRIQVKKNALKVFGLSLLIWVAIFGSNYALQQAFGVNLSYIEVILTSTCIILFKFIPLQVLSGFGIHETLWVFIALALGISKDLAITAALGTHVLSTVFLFFFGLYGFWNLKFMWKNTLFRKKAKE